MRISSVCVLLVFCKGVEEEREQLGRACGGDDRAASKIAKCPPPSSRLSAPIYERALNKRDFLALVALREQDNSVFSAVKRATTEKGQWRVIFLVQHHQVAS
jgi:hypothetical protein